MPFFDVQQGQMRTVDQINFSREKELQTLIEKNLGTVFNCRFVATEFSTGAVHAGRIDSLALSEEDNPVIIEYKKVESSELINQSLFYLHWLRDHKGDFELAVRRALGDEAQVDWSAIRVICLAPNYKKYDLHAVQVMGADIELWRYRLYSNNSILLEEVNPSGQTSRRANGLIDVDSIEGVVPTHGIEGAGREVRVYTFEERVEGKSPRIVALVESLREFIMEFETIEEVPRKDYIAYKASQNVVCIEVQARLLKVFIKLNPEDVPDGTPGYRDVTNIGHFGTGRVEFTVNQEADIDVVKPFIEKAYNRIG